MKDARLTLQGIEIDPVKHCNLRCLNCNHSTPYASVHFGDVEAFERDATLLARSLRVRRFKIFGGEPLLHPRLLDFVRAARRSGLSDEVLVGTNGLLLARQGDEFWREVDIVSLSLYPAVEGKLDLPALRARAAEHGKVLRVTPHGHFRQFIVDFPNEDAALVRTISNACLTRHFCYTLHNGRVYRCPPAAFIDDYLTRLGYSTRFAEAGGLKLEDTPDMPDRLRRYLWSQEPLGACAFCVGTSGRTVPHRQLTAEEVAAPTRRWRVEDAIDHDLLNERKRQMRRLSWAMRLPGPFRRMAVRALTAGHRREREAEE